MIDLRMKVKRRAVSKDVKRGWWVIRVRDACLLSIVEMKRDELGWDREEKIDFNGLSGANSLSSLTDFSAFTPSR